MANQPAPNIAVLAEKIANLEREVKGLKQDLRGALEEIDDLGTNKAVMLLKMQGIENGIADTKSAIGKVEAAVTKDSGWRGFAIDVLKAVAQIAALVGAGKFIF